MLLDGPFYNKSIVLDIFRSFYMKLSRVLHIGSVALYCMIFISIILSNNSWFSLIKYATEWNYVSIKIFGVYSTSQSTHPGNSLFA